MSKQKKQGSIHWPTVTLVAVVAAAVLLLFFLDPNRQPQPPVVAAVDTVADNPLDDIVYYYMEADEFAKLLPADKVVLASRIDDTSHYVYYTETTTAPSCYVYDLDTRTTSVLFGGSKPFDCDGQMLKLKSLKDWRLVGDRLFFVFNSGADDVDYTSTVVAFCVDIPTERLFYINSGADAYFATDDRLIVIKAQLQHRSFLNFFGEDTYITAPIEYQLNG